MLNSRLTNCTECVDILGLIAKIDCKVAELSNCTYNSIIFALKGICDTGALSDLLNYRRILSNRYYNPEYASPFSMNDIAGRIVILTHGITIEKLYPFVPDPTTTTTTTAIPVTTTTTTTIPCVSWIYNMELFSCSTCYSTGGGTVSNSEPLTIGKYYDYNGWKMQPLSLNTCSQDAPGSFILDSSGTNNCEDVACTTTTTTTVALPLTPGNCIDILVNKITVQYINAGDSVTINYTQYDLPESKEHTATTNGEIYDFTGFGCILNGSISIVGPHQTFTPDYDLNYNCCQK